MDRTECAWKSSGPYDAINEIHDLNDTVTTDRNYSVGICQEHTKTILTGCFHHSFVSSCISSTAGLWRSLAIKVMIEKRMSTSLMQLKSKKKVVKKTGGGGAVLAKNAKMERIMTLTKLGQDAGAGLEVTK